MHVSVSYISKVENGKLHFGDYPSEKFIHKLAGELKADEDELLLLADKVPASIRLRIRQSQACLGSWPRWIKGRWMIWRVRSDLDNQSGQPRIYIGKCMH